MEQLRDQLAIQGFTFRAVDKGPEQFKLSIWNGRIDVAVFGGNGGAPIFKQGLSFDQKVMVEKLLTDIKTAAPGTKKAIVFQRWDESRKYVTDGTMVVGKDDKQVIYFEFQFSNNGNSKCLRFDARCAATVSMGVEPMADSSKSAVRIEAVLDWMKHYAPMAMLLSARKFQAGGNNNNRGGGNRGGAVVEDDSDFGGDSADF